MYIRTKTLKNKKYAYLVKARYYKKRDPKQVFHSYLGRIYEPNKVNDSFINLNNLIEGDINNIFKELIRNEINNYELYEHFIIDLNKLKVFNKKERSCVIKINNGYLCDYTLKNLFRSEPSTIDEKRFSREFARVLIEVGIDINKEIFVLLFDKIYKKKYQEISNE